MIPSEPVLQHPELEGGPFYWKAGPVGVLLLHGFTSTTAEVRPLAHQLLEHGYTVAGPLLPGHGTTPAESNRTKWMDWVNAVDDAYQGLCLHCEIVLVGGESLGGLLTLYLASEHPEIAGIMLYAAAYEIPGLFLAQWVQYFRPMITKKPSKDDLPWQGYLVNPTAGAAQLFNLQKQIRKRISKIAQAVLIIQGRLDQTINPASAQMIYDQIGSKQKTLNWLDHSSHVLLLDREFDQAVGLTLEFIKNTLEDRL